MNKWDELKDWLIRTERGERANSSYIGWPIAVVYGEVRSHMNILEDKEASESLEAAGY